MTRKPILKTEMNFVKKLVALCGVCITVGCATDISAPIVLDDIEPKTVILPEFDQGASPNGISGEILTVYGHNFRSKISWHISDEEQFVVDDDFIVRLISINKTTKEPYELINVKRDGSEELEGDIPAHIPAGTYSVRVITPFGDGAILPAALTITRGTGNSGNDEEIPDTSENSDDNPGESIEEDSDDESDEELDTKVSTDADDEDDTSEHNTLVDHYTNESDDTQTEDTDVGSESDSKSEDGSDDDTASELPTNETGEANSDTEPEVPGTERQTDTFNGDTDTDVVGDTDTNVTPSDTNNVDSTEIATDTDEIPTDTREISATDTVIPPNETAEAQRFVGEMNINGRLNESAWDPSIPIERLIEGTMPDEAFFDVLWDDDYFYVGVMVHDDTLRSDSNDAFDDDSVNIGFDANYDRDSVFEPGDEHCSISYLGDGLYCRSANYADHNGSVLYATQQLMGGRYSVEIAFPWDYLNIIPSPSPGYVFGFDVGVTDDDVGIVGSGLDGQIRWNDNTDEWWEPATFGAVVLLDE